MFLFAEIYGTQHVLIKVLEKWREKLDNNFIIGWKINHLKHLTVSHITSS